MSTTRKLWLGLATLLTVSSAVLLGVGRVIHQQAPPLPTAVLTADGQTLYTKADMELGRQVWQSIGGQQPGSIWGHGALLAPDWSADWLHREATTMLELLARDEGLGPYDSLDAPQQAALKARILPELRTNTYDAATDTITVSNLRAQAMDMVASHYMSLFSNDPATRKLREDYAMRDNTVAEMEHRRAITAFFWWTSWAAATQRPHENMSYTQNWPYEPLAGNTPTSTAFLWSIFSILFLILGIGLLLFCLRGIKPHAVWRKGWLRGSFWSLNVGLSLMGLLTLLPLGLLQLRAGLEHGYGFARSAKFMDRPLIHLLMWLRMPGDILFAVGALLISVFVASLWLAQKRQPVPQEVLMKAPLEGTSATRAETV